MASRVAPAEIEPIIYNDMRIVAVNYSPDNMGVVQAFNVNTNKLIWNKKGYKVRIKPFIEEDTEWIFIKEMKIENDKLIVIDENLNTYILDPNTGKSLNNKSNSIIIISIAAIIIVVKYIFLKHRKKPIN